MNFQCDVSGWKVDGDRQVEGLKVEQRFFRHFFDSFLPICLLIICLSNDNLSLDIFVLDF